MKKKKGYKLVKFTPVAIAAVSLTSCMPTTPTINVTETNDRQHERNPNIIFILADVRLNAISIKIQGYVL